MEEVRQTIILLGVVLITFVGVTKHKKIVRYFKWLFDKD